MRGGAHDRPGAQGIKALLLVCGKESADNQVDGRLIWLAQTPLLAPAQSAHLALAVLG